MCLSRGGFLVETFYSFQVCASLLGSVVQVIGRPAGRLADHVGHASSVRRAAWTDARLRLCRCPCRTRSAYGAVARAVCCTLARNSFVSSAYFFAPPTADPETFLFTAGSGSARTDGPLRAVAFWNRLLPVQRSDRLITDIRWVLSAVVFTSIR